MNKLTLGKSGEDLCCQYLSEKGYEIKARNFRTRYGEIDIIVKDRDVLVFVEVKTRTKEDLDDTKWSISQSKQRKLTRTALSFISEFPDDEIVEYRFDVVIIKDEEITHLVNAFLPADLEGYYW